MSTVHFGPCAGGYKWPGYKLFIYDIGKWLGDCGHTRLCLLTMAVLRKLI